VRWCGVLAAASLLLAAPAAGQGVRITGVSTARYAELATAAPDSVPIESTAGAGTLRLAPDGTVVRCTEGLAWCHFMGAGERLSTVPLIQDVRASAWGFGQGVRAFAHVRGRAAVGEADDLWPAADDPLDVLAAYVEVDRASYRVRLGRQWQTSSLGWYNFDGLAVAYRPLERLTVEAFGGWSLMRGTNEFHDDALDGVEPFFPSERAYILGALARVRPAPGMAGTLLYQREIRTDRAALYSERLAADGRVSFGRAAVSGALEADLASGWLNEARLRADVPLGRGFAAAAEVRRYRPFFELWTIWGAFAPVGYGEGSGMLAWGRPDRLGVRLTGAWRSYDAAHAGLQSAMLRTDGWRVGTDGWWRPAGAWTVSGAYRRHINFGAAQSEADAAVRRDWDGRGHVGAHGALFQSIREFSLGEGVVAGLGADAAWRLNADTRLSGSATAYRHLESPNPGAVDWTQLRATLQLEWAVGRDPGMPPTGGRP
jgi:hypothetical protein